MKKILFFTLISFACCTARAQFGITGGLNIAKYDYVSDRTNVLSFNTGIFYRSIKKKGVLAVQPALLYTGKGAVKYPEIDVNNDILKYTNHINYAELSLPFIFSLPIDDEGILRFEFGVGPYAAYAVHATYTAETYEGDKTTANYKIGSTNTDDFKPFDAGLSIMGSMKISSVGFTLQYDLGLSNVNPVTTAPPLKMRALMFNMFIYFGK